MNNKFYNIPNYWYQQLDNTNNINMNIPDLANPKEGFLKGNMFNNTYDPYKNYKYGDLVPTSEREDLLFNILMYNFALTDLELYLDIYPNDQNTLNLYKNYLSNKLSLVDKYTKMYGPLTLDNMNMQDTWSWETSPWPWEVTK